MRGVDPRDSSRAARLGCPGRRPGHLPQRGGLDALLYPNTIARLDQLGVLDRLRSRHDVPFVANRIIGLGHEIAGDLRDTFTRGVEPSELMTPERMARWFADAPAPATG